MRYALCSKPCEAQGSNHGKQSQSPCHRQRAGAGGGVGGGDGVGRSVSAAGDLNDDGVAERDEKACFGCGVCARFCPEEAISLKEGWRKVCILPPRLRQPA